MTLDTDSGSRSVTVANPVLRGFNPDPSILRVGELYYIATSTFEWFPGIRLHRSRDLAHWEVVGHALDERLGFDLRGHPDSGGVWAPSLSHVDGEFWLAYSVVRTMEGHDLDADNYLVTSHSIHGPWSEPIPLGSRGFDFSFFHDRDGSHWIVGVQWDQRPEHPGFGGIVLEQYDPVARRVSGDAGVVYQQEELIEGPNLYQVDDGYLLLLAEGGTGWNHGVTQARAATIRGPFERDAERAVLTSRDAPGLPLQKAGHGELVQTEAGEWALVHLAARPVLAAGERYSTLGRETSLQRVEFDDRGWLRLADGGHHPATAVEFRGLPPHPFARPPARDDFDAAVLDTTRWSSPRTAARRADLAARPGWLRLGGGQSPSSVFDQSMIAQRVEEHRMRVETVVDAHPETVRQSAGLIAWYDRAAWAWLQLTWDAENGRHLRVVSCDGGAVTRSAPIAVGPGAVRMRMRLDGPDLEFATAASEGQWTVHAERLPAWKLSDDHGGRLRFTGLMAGIRADDLDGVGWSADFDYVDVAFEEAG